MKLYPAQPRVEYGAVLLDISAIPALPAEISFRDQKWVLKPELHVTILSPNDLDYRYLLRMYDWMCDDIDALRATKRAILESVVKRCLDGLEFSVGIEPAFYFVRKDYAIGSQAADIRRSLVASCFVLEVEEFRNRFYMHSGGIERYGRGARVPYHVTLYTGDGSEGEQRGIGISGYDEWNRYASKLAQTEVPPELKAF